MSGRSERKCSLYGSVLYSLSKQSQSANSSLAYFNCFVMGLRSFHSHWNLTESVLPDIHNKLKMLQDGKRTETYMSDEEEEFMFNFGFALAIKHPVVAFKVYVVRALNLVLT